MVVGTITIPTKWQFSTCSYYRQCHGIFYLRFFITNFTQCQETSRETIFEVVKYLSSFLFIHKWLCSETTLTGESRFHISPPRGFEPESLVAGSKQVVHWTSETWWESCEIAGSPQCSPPTADSVGWEARRETCSERETGTGKLCDQVDLGLHIVGAERS